MEEEEDGVFASQLSEVGQWAAKVGGLLWQVIGERERPQGFASLRLPRSVCHDGDGASRTLGYETEHELEVLTARGG